MTRPPGPSALVRLPRNRLTALLIIDPRTVDEARDDVAALDGRLTAEDEALAGPLA